jgi:hypothetical protein
MNSDEKVYGNILLQRSKRSIRSALEHTDDNSHILVYRIRINKKSEPFKSL